MSAYGPSLPAGLLRRTTGRLALWSYTPVMLILYPFPSLFGVADNNGYGLKVYAFLKLAGVPFIHEHTFDASAAPRGQLPYIVDGDETIGDSDAIITHLIAK